MENAQLAYGQASTPAQRVSARDRLLARAGKTQEDQLKAVALQGGTDAAGNNTDGILGAVNERTRGDAADGCGAARTGSTVRDREGLHDAQGRRARFNGAGWDQA